MQPEAASFTIEMSALSAVTGCLKTCLLHWERLSEADRLDLVRRAYRSAERAVRPTEAVAG
jgi:hypothetical protein